MTIDERIAKVQQEYKTIQTERNELVTQANDKMVQLDKLAAQFELLNDLKAEEADKTTKSNKKATAIDAVPEE